MDKDAGTAMVKNGFDGTTGLLLGLALLSVIGGAMLRNKWGGLLALIPLSLVFVGCTAMQDLGEATASAVGVATPGDIPPPVGPDGVGLGWGEGGAIGLISIILVNFLRNRARRLRGEPVKTPEKSAA